MAKADYTTCAECGRVIRKTDADANGMCIECAAIYPPGSVPIRSGDPLYDALVQPPPEDEAVPSTYDQWRREPDR